MRFIILFIFFGFILNFSKAQTFTSTAGGVIPDNGTAFTFFPITVSGVGNINTTTGLKSVCINITHDFTDELEIYLISPDNNIITLSIQNGGGGANYVNTCFDMSAPSSINLAMAPCTGSFLPGTPLGWFNNGNSANGVWRLAVIDVAEDDFGNLNNWNITFGSTPAPQPVPNCAGNPPANNFCSNAPLICNNNTYCGNTDFDYSRNSWTSLTTAATACNAEGVFLNSFLKFVASATTATFNVAVSNSNIGRGITMLAYEGACGATVTAKGCTAVIPVGATNTFTATGLTVGNTYYLTMDITFNAMGTPDFCDYAITALTGVQITTPTFTAIPPFCSGAAAPVLPLMSTNGITGTWAPAIVSNTASGTYTFTPTLGQCGRTATLNITVNPTGTPTFAAVSPICTGATAPLLPTTSTNGVVGTWMPAMVSNTASGMYTFTPSAGQCTMATASVSVTVNPNVTPTFAAIPAFCSGATAPVLPPMSTNGIAGTWAPALISNMASGSYTFTPNAGQCATTAILNVTVNPNVTPTFAAIAPICNGAMAPVLPAMSTNGISGSWVPALVSNTASGTYTFTPSAGQCATTATLNVIVNPDITPTFAVVAPICSGSAAPVLPTTSTNGIMGTWLPAIVSNTMSATYTFTPNAGQGCVTTATLNVTVAAMPATPTFAAIGPICSGGAVPMLPATSSNGFIGTWAPATINNMASGMYTFTPNAGQCATNATISITVTGSITPTFAAIGPICSGVTAPLLPVTSTNGITGTWMPATVNNTTSATYTFTPNAGQCGTTATLNVTVNPSVITAFAAIAPICSGATAPVLSLTSTNGITGTWVPALVSNTTSGTYTFTPNAGQCGSSAILNVTVNPNVTPTFATIPPICSGAAAPTLATTSTNGVAGSWSPATINNMASGMYTFTPNAGQCATGVSINVTVSSSITPTFAAIAPFCNGTVAPLLAATSTNGITGTWMPATISNSASGTYTFTPNAGQCGTTAILNVTVNPLTLPTFTAIAPFCSGNTAPILPLTSTNGVSGTWVPAAVSNTVSGSYTFTPNAGQCASNATLNVTVNPFLTPTFTQIPPICTGTTAPTFSNVSTNGFTGTWVPAIISNTSSSSYTFTPNVGQGCLLVATMNILVSAASVVPNFAPIPSVCQGGAVPILPVSSIDGFIGTWSPAIIDNMASGTYTFTPNAGQCATTATLNINVVTNLLPTFNAIPDICNGATAPLLVTTSNNGFAGTWSPATVSNTMSGTYTFTPAAGLCATNTTLMVNVNPILTPTFTPLVPFCNGSIAPLLQATSTNGISGTWLPVTINNTASSTYTFTPAAGFCASGTTINATVIPLPYANIGMDSVMCEGDSVLLDITNADPTATYLWQDATTNSTFWVKTPGTYSVKVSLNGCDNIGSKVITYTLLPRFTFGPDKGLCIGDTLTLSPVVTSADPFTYLWQDGSILPSLKVWALGPYSLDVTNSCGTTSDNIFITNGVCDLILPKAFTPNNDGRNDILRVRGDLPAKSFKFSIYNRYGQRIFYSTDVLKGWDGKINGVAQATGTYVYQIDYVNALSNVRRTYNGAVTLIR